MSSLIYNSLGYWLYKRLIMPFRRTPVQWALIIFNKSGQFVVCRKGNDTFLPSGQALPNLSIPEACRRALGRAPLPPGAIWSLRSLGVVGRGIRGITVYYAAKLPHDTTLVAHGGDHWSFVDRSTLNLFVPAEISDRVE